MRKRVKNTLMQSRCTVSAVIEGHQGNAYPAVYTLKIAGEVYVLYCFQKKSVKGAETPKPDMEIIRERLQFVLNQFKE